MEQLLQLDQYWFELVNQAWHTDFLDAIMPYWRDKKFWIPLYAGLIVWTGIVFKQKAIWFVLGVVLCVGVADTVSSKILKPSIQRLRPCNDPDLKASVQLLVRCGSGYSFTSSHATNHFAIALFIMLTLGAVYPAIRLPFLFWAASIAFGQVYVGVHYPLDVLGGSLLGAIIGTVIALIFNKFDNFRLAKDKTTKPAIA